MLFNRKAAVSCWLSWLLLVGCATVPQEETVRSTGTSVDDRQTERYLRREVIALGDQRPLRVKVRVFNRSVLLVGEVERNYAKNLLHSKAEKLREVDHVFNQIAINNPLPNYHGFDDLLLAGRVRFAITSMVELDNIDMDYLVDRQNIYLLGIVTPAQGQQVIDRMSQLEGVESIIVAFDYIAE